MDTNNTPNSTDPRPMLAKVVALTGQTIAGIETNQFDNPTPCGNFTVRQLLGHLLSAMDRVAVVGRNVENPFARPEHFDAENGDWSATWNRFAAEAEAAWEDPAKLQRPTALPWAAESGDLALRSYIAEFTTHTWDLAMATNQRPEWDTEVLRESIAVMQQILPAAGRMEMFAAIKATMPEEMRAGENPYSAAVSVADDAPLIDQLVAHVGRQPAAPPS